jgi:hypothetical protein
MRGIDAIMEQYERLTQQEREAFKDIFRDWTQKSDELLAEANAKIAALAVGVAPPEPRIALETAKAIAEKALGTADGIKPSELDPDAYVVNLGRLWCEIRIDAYGGRLIEVMILGAYGATYLLYDPVTLEEDTAIEERYRLVNSRNIARYWVKQNGEAEFRALIGEVQTWIESEGDKT